MLAMRSVQLPGINYVFKKDKNGNYTKSALLYQDIFRYAIFRKKENLSYTAFKHREIAGWLVTNNRELLERYEGSHTTISNRIEYTQDRTKGSLQDLVDLD